MSLPTSKPSQLSIRSFFQSKQPKYAPPPSQSKQPPAPTPQPASDGPPRPPPSPPAADAPAAARPSEPSPVEIPPLPADLPHEASIRLVTTADINPLRRINALLLPVAYPDDFYRGTTDPDAWGNTSRVITWAHDGEEPKVVGGVVARVEPVHAGTTAQTVYIRSLCILSPYRSLGLIGAAVDNIVATAVADPSLDVKTVSAHVWTENDEGLRWYDARGFKRDAQPVNGYYRKLRPDSAWLVRRDASAPGVKSVPAGAQPRAVVEASPTAAVVNLPPMAGPPMAGPPKAASTPPPRASSGQSYQNQRPETEWNDLPADMASGLGPPKKGSSEPGSSASSQSGSTMRKKRDRSYPAAAFGGA
ncbi:hypothetical protein ACO1O0_005559 [Amphichorda felina]